MIKNNQSVFEISSSNYLVNCDSLNKYNLKTLNKVPKIEKIYINILLKDFLSASGFFNKKEITDNIKLKASIFYYILFSMFPSTVFQNIKSSKHSKTQNDGYFILTFCISNKDEINSFLSKLTTDNTVFRNQLLTHALNINKIDSKLFSFGTIIKCNSFFEINDFFLSKIKDINLKKIISTTNVVLSNVPKQTNINNILINLCSQK